MRNKICPTCGRDDFKSRHGMKLHHSRAHGESIAGEKVPCDQCGEILRRSPNRIKENDHHFCDNTCASRFEISDRILEHFLGYDGEGEVDVECDYCGDTFKKDPWAVLNSERNFCDKQCHGGWISESIKTEDHPSYSERVEVKCSNCGEKKEIIPSRSERSNHYFCDEDCMYDWRSENWVGEDAPAWSGGTARQNYGEGWTRQREKAKQRDFHRCRCCNISEEEALNEYGEGLHVHHRTPFKLFDDSAEANRVRNLLTLCKSCHHALEWEFNRQSAELDSQNTDHRRGDQPTHRRVITT